MPLTLVLGPANSAKAGEVLGRYATEAERGGLLVVPNALDARHYARELATGGTILGSVVTFAGLAGEIARRAGYDARVLTALQRRRVLANVVRSADLKALGDAAHAPGFAAAAGDLFEELERSLVSPRRFTAAMRAWGVQDARRDEYAADLAALYMRYSRELERLGRVDSSLYAWRALDALRAAPGAWGSGAVFFYGFDDLHPLQRDAIETLATLVGVPVTVSLTYEPGRAALAARAEALQELSPLAERVIEMPARDDYYEPESRAALHHLERSLFEPASQRVDPGPAVRLLEAGGERAEAELVAAEVLALLRDGVAAEEIAVVYRSTSRVAALVERVFGQYGVAVAIERELRFGHTSFGRALLALARCGLLGPERAPANDLLDYVRYPGLLERPELADRLEVQIRRGGLRSAAEARAALGFRLEEIEALARAADPAAELARVGRRLLSGPHRGAAPVFGADEERDARALAVLLGALEQLSELGEPVAREELIEVLEDLRLPAGAAVRPGAVLLADPLSIRARRFRAVFVCGLQEGEFPEQGVAEPFLSDESRRELAQCAGLRLRQGEDALVAERYLFYSCISRATGMVALSYRSADEEGNLALPSPFVADVADLLAPEWPERRRARLLADVVWPADEAPTERERARSLAAAAAPVLGEPVRVLPPLSEGALRHVRHREIVSGGALEAYAACPVKWLVERELQPAAVDPDSDALARGSYMHAALEEVLRRLDGPVTPRSLPEAVRILDEVLRSAATAIAPGSPAGVRRALLRMIEADLTRYLEHEAGDGCEWKPRALELRFGFEGEEDSLPPLDLDGVRVRGAIDRIDADPTGRRAIVRDYKSGNVRAEYQGARWRLDRRLQVALYMLAVRDLLGLEPVAGLYQPLGGGDLRPRGVFVADAELGSCVVGTDERDPDSLREELENAAGRAVELARRLRAGELTPCPATCSRQGCSYPSICRSQ